MRLLLVIALLAACASPEPVEPPGPVPGTTVSLSGEVTSVDLEPMTYDGDAIIVLATDDGPTTVRIPARMNLCQATGIDRVGSLQPGDVIEVRGESADDGSVTPCASSEHRLVVKSTGGAGVYRGVFESSFETSAFTPCDQPGEQWWVGTTDPDFSEQFDILYQQHKGDGGRGLRLLVETTVVGELTDEGEYGHLGQYSRRLTVTDTREMVFLAANPDSTVSCR